MPELTETLGFGLYSGAGNTFVVAEFESNASGELADLARAICVGTNRWLHEPRSEATDCDGLLALFAPSGARADVRLEIYNADGTRAEACGNGLRVVGKYVDDTRSLARDEVVVETAVGERRVELLRRDGRVAAARASLGQLERGADLHVELDGLRVEADAWSAGNPHAVVFARDLDLNLADVERVGRALERAVPGGINVELVEPSGTDAWRARVWERGVGETAACGSGACAVAAAVRERGLSAEHVDVEFPGGTLRVEWDASGHSLLTGPCERLGAGAFPLVAR